jgi:hypothetical protein
MILKFGIWDLEFFWNLGFWNLEFPAAGGPLWSAATCRRFRRRDSSRRPSVFGIWNLGFGIFLGFGILGFGIFSLSPLSLLSPHPTTGTTLT